MNNIIYKILERHQHDKEQLEVIQSDKKRLIVEAPAGYGKTQTMTSKIAYLLITGKVPNPKKILVMTFSVNAAQKIKKDILEELQKLDKNRFTIDYLNKRITATNYHGFARQIIKKHGYIYNPSLKKINSFKILEDSSEKVVNSYSKNLDLNSEDVKLISDFKNSVESRDKNFIKHNSHRYKKLLLEKIIPENYITYNGILALACCILHENEKLLNFYKKLYPFIIIDEFQDTNLLSFYLINLFLKDEENQNFIVLGDPLQQIYGFIGSIPRIFKILEKKYKFSKIELKNNYRFKENEYLLKIDRIIREHAKNPSNPNINDDDKVCLKICKAKNQIEEVEIIKKSITNIIKNDNSSKIAILFRNGKNDDTNAIIDGLKGIDFFYALFTDEDKNYRLFHERALEAFNKELKERNVIISKTNWERFVQVLGKHVTLGNKDRDLINSLLYLMNIFYEKDIKIQRNKLNLPTEEIITYIEDIFINRQLRQYLKYVDKNIILTTVHSAKGLEWDYVILPDMEKYGFPARLGLCQYCEEITEPNCKLIYSKIIDKPKFIEEISTFYVACTRAKKDLIFTYSEERLSSNNKANQSSNKANQSSSCFLTLEGFLGN